MSSLPNMCSSRAIRTNLPRLTASQYIARGSASSSMGSSARRGRGWSGEAIIVVALARLLARGAVLVLHPHHVDRVERGKPPVHVVGALPASAVLVEVVRQVVAHLEFLGGDEDLLDAGIQREQVRQRPGGARAFQVADDRHRKRSALDVGEVEVRDERVQLQQGLGRVLLGAAAAVEDARRVAAVHHFECESVDQRMIALTHDDRVGQLREREQGVDLRLALIKG